MPRDRAVETLGGGGERRQTWRLRRGAGTIERAPKQSTWMSFSERVPYRKSLRRGRSQKVTRSKYQRDRRADPRWAAKTVDGTSAGTRFWRGVSEHYITSITSLRRSTSTRPHAHAGGEKNLKKVHPPKLSTIKVSLIGNQRKKRANFLHPRHIRLRRSLRSTE